MSKALRLGIFVAGSLLVLAVGVFLIGNKDFLFSSTYRLRADFENVAGLSGGAEVRVGGIHEGTVRRIDLPQHPDGKVTIWMDLENSTRNVLKKDSIASIKSEGLLGDKYVEISFGSTTAERLGDGDSIGSAPPLDIADLIKKTNDILDTTKNAMQNVDGATSNLQAISGKINQGQGTVGALINDKTVYQEARAGAAAFADNMEALKHNFFLRGFFRKRGYEDSDELTKHEISRLPSEPYMKRFEYQAAQVFEKPEAAKLKNQKALSDAGTFLQDNQFGLAVVVASSGVKGDTDKSRLLTEAQSMMVRDYLTQNFRLDDTRIRTIGLGKAMENSDSGKVDILVYPVGVKVAAPNTSSRKR